MFRVEEIPQLQRAAGDELVRPRLRGMGIGATIFGVLALFGGVMPPANLVLAGLGAALSFVGLWNLVMVTATGLLMSSITLALVGVYNIASVFVPQGAGAPNGVWAGLGALQLVWAWQRFGFWQRFRHTLAGDTPAPLRARVKQMLSDLRQSDPKRNADAVHFTTAGAGATMLKLRLCPEGALALSIRGDDVTFASRPQVRFDGVATGAAQGKVTGTLTLGARSWKGTMVADQAERLRGWIAGAEALRAAA